MHAGQPDSSHCRMRSVEQPDWRDLRLPGDATVFGSTVVITKVSSNVFKKVNPMAARKCYSDFWSNK